MLMMLHKVYCLVNHNSDYKMQNFLVVLKAAKKDEDFFSKIQARMLADFYGGAITVLFIFAVEIVWLAMGVFSSMWPYFLGMFAFNYIIHRIMDKMYVSSVGFFMIKVAHLLVYSGITLAFLNKYYHWL